MTFHPDSQQHYEKLSKFLAQTGGEEILALIQFLDALGYRIALGTKNEQTIDASD